MKIANVNTERQFKQIFQEEKISRGSYHVETIKHRVSLCTF